MAKEFKRANARPSDGKRVFGAKKERTKHSEDNSSFKRKRDADEEGRGEKKFREKKPAEVKRSRSPKSDEKSSFQRYRDNAKPSDYGASRKSPGRNAEGGDAHREERPFKKRSDSGERSFSRKKPSSGEERPSDRRSDSGGNSFSRKKTFSAKVAPSKKAREANPYDLDESDLEYGKENNFKGSTFKKKTYGKKESSGKRKGDSKPQRENDDGMIRLNKYISNAGICSRREADELIASGVVQVNGKTITEMGFRVKPSDIVKYGGQTLKKERMVYLVLNKPKDYITTVDDPEKRRTVLELVSGACKERIYPVGRLDRSTTGLLMFTNDGELTKKLTHPRYGVRKIYHVELDKPLKKQDLDQVSAGLELEDGEIKVDEISYVGDGKDKTQIGVELHSGKNRIVRRIFEHLGYNVRKLDRVMFGSLTKKDLPRGRWRFLTEAEIGILNMISSDAKKN